MKKCLLLILSFTTLCYPSDLQMGASKTIITPPLGTPMSGYYYERGATGVHDDLYTRALVFEKNSSKIVLISCDLIDLPHFLVEEIRKEIKKQTGIAGENVMISATHTHTGPVIPESWYAVESSSNLLAKYILKLPAKIAGNVRHADTALQPATIRVGTGHETSISFNRRFLMNDGTVGWNPGRLNPDIIEPVGPIDPEVIVIYVESSSGTPIATYTNFALHLDTVGGTEFSADFPCTLTRLLSQFHGPEMITMFTNGCCGNVNHIDVKWPERQKGHDEASRIGTVLTGEVLKTYTRLKSVKIETIAVEKIAVELPLAVVHPAELPKAEDIKLTYGTDNPAPFLEMVNAFKVIDVLERQGKPIEAEVQVVALGSQIAFISLPGEIFVELGLAIKDASPFPVTVVASLSNGNIGYVPDRKAYSEGNYEPISARCAPGSGEKLVSVAVRMLEELHKQSLRAE